MGYKVLGKTEQKLLEMAKKQGGRCSISTAYGRGPKGGRVSGGARERDAMFKLVNRGLIRIIDRQPWEDYNRGYKQSGNTFAFELI